MHTSKLTRRVERGAAGAARLARLVSSLILALSVLAGLFSPPQPGGGGGGLLPLRTAQASSFDLKATITTGTYHTCALNGGQVYCWGWNNGGQLGNGTYTQRTTPTLVAGGAMGSNSGVTAIDAGWGHTCALKGGKVYCWGWNSNGRLGDGTTTDRTTPVLVADGAMVNSGVTAIAGGLHTCAIKSGALYCWGGNWVGQLGDGTTTDRTTPTLVADGEMGNSGVTAVAASDYHTCALKGGQVYCWGSNGVGKLGDGTTTQRTTPTLVANGAMGNSGVTAVAAGWEHTLGLKDTTCLFAWGWNGRGQLGDGTTTHRTTPVQVSGGCGWGTTPRVFIPIVYRP